MEHPLLAVDSERRFLLLMKRAKPNVFLPERFQLDAVGFYDGDNVGGAFDLFGARADVGREAGEPVGAARVFPDA